jgi:hypothetical protein
MDKEVILAIVNGPGATWGWMVFSIMGGIVIIYIVKTLNDYERAFQEGRNAERREGDHG